MCDIKEMIVCVDGHDYRCRSFFDTDNNENAVDIYNNGYDIDDDNVYIGQINDIEIPDVFFGYNEDIHYVEEIEIFKFRVKEFVNIYKNINKDLVE